MKTTPLIGKGIYCCCRQWQQNMPHIVMSKHLKIISAFLKASCIFFIISLVGCQSAHQRFENPCQGFVSWKPAPAWDEALLSGNGTMGAMVFGNPHEETVIVNHALHYLPNWIPQQPIDQASRLKEIRSLLSEGKYREAARVPQEQSMIEGYGEKKWIDPFVPFCNIIISMPPGDVENYVRMVDFSTGEAKTEWEQNGRLMQRSLFVSRPDSVIVLRISGSDKVSASLALSRHPVSWDQWDMINGAFRNVRTSAREGFLIYTTEFRRKWNGIPDGFEAVARVIPTGGEVKYEGDRMIVADADEILFLMRVVPNYNYEQKGVNELKNDLISLPADYGELLFNHKKVHGDLFNRVKLDIEENDEADMQSETLVLQARRKTSSSIIEKQFDAARYNIISSTGTNPPNLQGIWSGTWTPPWSSGFTHDGNVEVAVSSLLPSNTPELMKAYMEYHERMMPCYRDNARRLFGCRGIALPAHSSTHGWNIHFDEEWCLTFWTGGAGWASGILYDYFLYTGDEAYLKHHIYPFMKESALFYEDFLFPDDNGKYVFSPSYSPENTPANSNAQAVVNATMDVMIAKELLRNCIEAGKIIGEEETQIAKWEMMLTRMPEYRINEDGALAEWLPENLKDNYQHRHVSHLYALYEIIAPEFKNNPELMTAAREAVERRMVYRRHENGGEMAFGLAQMGMIAANLGDSEIAGEIINWISRYYFTPSLGTYHNSGHLFNMDISGGFPAVVMRTLAYSEPGFIKLLPALPHDWKKGSIEGMALRGQIIMDNLSWDDDRIEVKLTSAIDQEIILETPGSFQNVESSINEAIDNKKPEEGVAKVVLNKEKPVSLSIRL
ncbi:glycosyl hydrolase family 95 catalytic domain-containing protein [Anaerophaga thermohalophila]|uniref:glycosyl hydrolase family 95 catalytic domain-containing protein n=1 Tax=Anaerophaga thermohalophila TaxID=177400 RepID=UPI001FDFC403|nr:glycoside hydrolase N-terminal domain-containing protein [Anaerophaga thermohalophila]